MTRRLDVKPRQQGFALIVVLWAVGLFSLLVAQIGEAARTQLALSLNLRRSAALQAQADAAIAAAAFHLVAGTVPFWTADGRPYDLRMPDDDAFADDVVVRIVDQAGKVDLNKASVPLLQDLLVTVGEDQATAAKLSTSILAWRFPTGAGAPAAMVAAPYKRAGLDYTPPGLPFQSLDELRLVIGVTPALLAALAPHLTIYQIGGINPALTDPVVKRALAAGGPLESVATPSASGLRVVEINATAYGAMGTAAVRDAILQIGPQKQGWMRILTWSGPRS